MSIIKKDVPKLSTLSVYHIALNLIGYISFYNCLIELNKQTKKHKNLDYFMNYANCTMLKDLSVLLNELYKFSEFVTPNFFNENKSQENKNMRKFIKKLRNGMKFFPSTKTLHKILEKEKNKYPSNILQIKKNDILYDCGYYMGENVIFGSNLYFEYVFGDALKVCVKNNDLYKYTNIIMKHLEIYYRLFEKHLFYDESVFPVVKLKKRKDFFQIYNQSTSFAKMKKRSKYNETEIFVFMLLIQEISSLEIYLNYMIDLKESIKNNILLYFFTHYVSIKYDEIRDAIKLLMKKFEKETNYLKEEIVKLNIFQKEITDFAYKLRNFHHFEEVLKYEFKNEKDFIAGKVSFQELYLKVVKAETWPDDYELKLFEMLSELNTLLKFLRKNVGIYY